MVNITFMNLFPSEAFYVFHIHYLFELKHSLAKRMHNLFYQKVFKDNVVAPRYPFLGDKKQLSIYESNNRQ